MPQEKPILFSAPMVRAIIEDRKWQTRRIMKPQPEVSEDGRGFIWTKNLKKSVAVANRKRKLKAEDLSTALALHCPLGKPGDQLWVRETHGFTKTNKDIVFRADGGWADAPNYAEKCLEGGVWRPSIFMFRQHSRIDLKIRGIRVEQLLDISDEDARAEGAIAGAEGWTHDIDSGMFYKSPRDSFLNLWAKINGKQSVASNPWVWITEFSRVQA